MIKILHCTLYCCLSSIYIDINNIMPWRERAVSLSFHTLRYEHGKEPLFISQVRLSQVEVLHSICFCISVKLVAVCDWLSGYSFPSCISTVADVLKQDAKLDPINQSQVGIVRLSQVEAHHSICFCISVKLVAVGDWLSEYSFSSCISTVSDIVLIQDEKFYPINQSQIGTVRLSHIE